MHIQLIGTPGLGKSTVSKALAIELNGTLFQEPWILNEYIPRVIAGSKEYLQCQARMLHLSRWQENHASKADLAIIDGGLLQTQGFINAFHKLGYLTRDEYESLCSLRRKLTFSSDRLVIRLEAKTKVALKRLNTRGRDMEVGYTKEYLKAIAKGIHVASCLAAYTVDASQSVDQIVQDILVLYKT